MRVGVVGTGLAGLTAAYELERMGFSVVMLETRRRVGGRLQTVAEGDYLFEAGGEWIDAEHTRIVELAREFGIETEPAPPGPGRVFLDGEWSDEKTLWPDVLADVERVEAEAERLASEIGDEPWRNPELAELDQRTVHDFFLSMNPSPRGLKWLTAKYRSDEGEDLDRVSLLGWLWAYRNYLGRAEGAMSAVRLVGGMQGLCAQIAARIQGPIWTGATLRRVCQVSDKAYLQFEDGEVAVDRAVLAIPARTVARVSFDPDLPPKRMRVFEKLPMARAAKICWRFLEPWWRRQGWNGRMLTDLRIQQTWDGSRTDRPVLSAYIAGAQAVEFSVSSEPVADGAEALFKIFPEARESYVGGAFFEWSTDPHAVGAFPSVPPGGVFGMLGSLREPFERVHFAGDHTARWFGFAEGAVESGLRAAQEIRDAESR